MKITLNPFNTLPFFDTLKLIKTAPLLWVCIKEKKKKQTILQSYKKQKLKLQSS